MTSQPPDESSREGRLNEILAEYMQSADAGAAPDKASLIERHPEFAAELEEFFGDKQRFDRLAAPFKPAVGSSSSPDADQTDRNQPQASRNVPTLPPSEPAAAVVATVGPPRVRYFGDYELLDEIARGGMGVVYRARQVNLKRTVAIKMILAGQLASGEDVKRFYAEAEAAAKLEHPNIVPIFEIGQAEGQHYFSMAFIEGESLAHRISRAVLPPREAAQIMHKVARAIAFAHVEGVIHRDLKPANVLLDTAGEPHVTDFGLAKRVTTEPAVPDSIHQLTATGQILGTPSYMPPEQASGRRKEIGPLADVYALGAVLYCAITGRPPFQAATPLDTLLQVLEQDPVPPRQLNAAIPRDLETIAMKCLEKEPRLRYRSAQELADELERFQNDEPIHARPINMAERTWRWLKKQQRSAVVGTTAALAAVIVLVASFAAWRFYEQSQLGFLQLKTESTENSVLVAELFNERDEPAAAPFTVPTKESVPLVAGSYRLRVSGSGLLSETFLLDVDPGSEQSFTVGLAERKLPNPIAVGASHLFEAVNLDGAIDFILLPQPYNKLHGWKMRRVSAATGKTIWEVNWDPRDFSAKEIAGLFQTEEDRQHWSRLVHSAQSASDRPELVPIHDDLNGDGTGDLVWAAGTDRDPAQGDNIPPMLVAVSGKDGKPAWWFRARTANGSIAPRGTIECVPNALTIGTGRSQIVALLQSQDECWIEAIAADDGSSLWRFPFDPQWLPGKAPRNPIKPALCTIAGKSVIVALVGTRLVGLDAATGEQAWPAHDLGFEPVHKPEFADLDGDGSDDMLIHSPAPPTQDTVLMGLSLATREPFWPAPVPVRNHHVDVTISPTVADLTSDSEQLDVVGTLRVPLQADGPKVRGGEADGTRRVPATPVVIMQIQGAQSRYGYTGVEVRDGATGALRWERRFPIHLYLSAQQNRAADRHAVGPDLDGDGFRELFVISTRADFTQRGGDTRHPSLYSLFVDAFSGKDGRTIWWSRIPLGNVLPTKMSSGIGPVFWGPPGPDGRPSLVVPVTMTEELGLASVSHWVFSFCTGTGRVLHVGQNLWPPIPARRDFNRDGITDLCSFVPDDPSTADFSDVRQNPAGKLAIFRGMPPESWRRLGAWEPAADFDGDGHAELFKGGTSECIVASGRDGHITARWKTGWGVDGIGGHSKPPRIGYARHSLALPHGDLNRDGIADVLLCATYTYFNQNRNRPNVDRPGRLFLPLQATSGRTGERLWLAGDIPDPVKTNHAYLNVVPYSPTCEDLDGDGTPDVLCPFSCYQFFEPAPGSGFPRRLGLAMFSGLDGTLRWTQMLEDEIALNKGKGGIANDAFTPPIATALVDLNADGVRDVIVTVAIREDHGVEIQALDGHDGKRLWQRSLARQWRAAFYPEVSPQPACGDLDGDGRPEVVAVESGGLSGIWTQYKVTALNCHSGEPKWTWQYANPSRGGDRIGDNDWPRVVLADLDGDGRPSVCIGVQDRGANEKPAIVILDQHGQVAARHEGEVGIWAADVDGDGRDELLYVTSGKVRATRGDPDDSLWEWPLPGGTGGILQIRPGERGQPATIVVEAAGESTIDHWGNSYLTSFPPQQGMGTRGDSVYGLDGATGKPIWRGRRDTTGISHVPPVVGWAESSSPTINQSPSESSRRRIRWDSRTRPTLPLLVNRSGDRTAAQLVLPTVESGKHLAPPLLASIAPVPVSDPRLMRRLPWVTRVSATGVGQFLDFVHPPAMMGLYSLVVLVIPALLLRGVFRRRWTLPGLMLVPVAFAVGFAGYKFVLALPRQQMPIPDPNISLVLQLLETVPGLPVLAFPTFLIVWTIHGRWWRLSWLLGASLVLSLVISAITIWNDSRGMDPAEQYSWNGWYLVLIMGSFAATALTLAAMLVSRSVQAIRSILRRPAQPA